MRVIWNIVKLNVLRRNWTQDCFSISNKYSWCLLLYGFVIGLLIPAYFDFDRENVKNYPKKTLEQKLYNEVKILCWVMTTPDNHKIRVPNILRTWGKRCNKFLVISSKEDKELDIIGLPVRDGGRKYLWEKLKAGFKYVYDNYGDEYDWIFKADDDTYVIVDNVRFLLYEYDPRSPIYFGFKFSPYVKQGYMSGGAGFVISNEALKRFAEIALNDPERCNPDGEGGGDDIEIGRCFENIGVIAGDSRDVDKLGRFFIFPPESHILTDIIIDLKYWYYKNMYYKSFDGLNGCSEYSISFHYVSGNITDILHYLIYHVKPYGINMLPRKLPKKKIYVQNKVPQKIQDLIL